MLNIYFGIFMFGMMLSLCYKAYTRVQAEEPPFTEQEFALLMALAIGVMMALEAGSQLVYRTSVLDTLIF
ncbi:MAG: hypothetical protein MJ055_03975 [Phascolarctobacterium sp.]|nr:hypothetical protein [Phascolarctobacterium sp.]